jgi:hypothetical protein
VRRDHGARRLGLAPKSFFLVRAAFRFADPARLDATKKSNACKELVAGFNRSCPNGVSRTRDSESLVEERDGA